MMKAVVTWRAGPLTKGAGLCHGTGGNGYAFLLEVDTAFPAIDVF
jgi:hypothetical protein